MKRLLTAAIGTPVVLAMVFLAPSLLFFAAMSVVMMVAGWEYVAIVRPRLPGIPRGPLLLLLPLIPAVAWALSSALSEGVGVGTLRLLLFGGALLLSVGLGTLLLLARTPLEETLPALGALGFGVLYFALPLSSLHLMQRLDPWIIFLLLAIVWLGDTAAYYVGSRIGRHKMAPVISPKKTWEGAVGGVLISMGVGAAIAYFAAGRMPDGLTPLVAAAIALPLALITIVSDLMESALKRRADIKDTGKLIPGIGGAFDLTDSLLLTAPLAYFIFLFVE